MPKKIAVIDDDVHFLELMETVLSQAGYDVHTIGNSVEAPKRIREFHPDLVLLDIWMPERQGWEVLELLKIDPHVRDIPIVFTTAAADEVRATGPLMHQWKVETLFKPFEISDLLRKVEDLIGKP